MIELYFDYAGEIVIVKVNGHNILFSTSALNYQTFVPIESISLKREGIIKEYPDLKDKPDGLMREEAIKRLKEYIKGLGSENEVKGYVIKELESQGYILKRIKRDGFRPSNVK